MDSFDHLFKCFGRYTLCTNFAKKKPKRHCNDKVFAFPASNVNYGMDFMEVFSGFAIRSFSRIICVWRAFLRNARKS